MGLSGFDVYDRDLLKEHKRTKQQAINLRVSWVQSLGEAKAPIDSLSAKQAIKYATT
jgi:hypothetical protein